MGVTIDGKNTSIDLGYDGFMRLRTTVAKVADEWLGRHYEKLRRMQFVFWTSKEEKERVFKEYDDQWKARIEEKPELIPVINFIYESDCEGELSVDDCKGVYEIIKDFDDQNIYGYAGRQDAAKFKDFKEVLVDCINNNCSMTWL